MKIICTEDMRIASLRGHVVLIKANEPRELPKDLGILALEQGAKIFSEQPEVIEEVTKIAEEKVEIVVEEKDDFQKLVDVMITLIDEGNPDNFKVDGTPKAVVVNKLSGSTITSEQREAAWEEALNLR